jgi:hypothetical protein
MSNVSAPAPFSVEEKAARAKVMVELYADPNEAPEEVVVDLVADLLHFAMSIGADIDHVVSRAVEVFDEERHA